MSGNKISETCLKQPLKNRQNKGLEAMHAKSIPLTSIKRLSVMKTYFLSSFEWPLKTGFIRTLNAIIVNFYHGLFIKLIW